MDVQLVAVCRLSPTHKYFQQPSVYAASAHGSRRRHLPRKEREKNLALPSSPRAMSRWVSHATEPHLGLTCNGDIRPSP